MNKTFKKTLITCNLIFGAIAVAGLISGGSDSGAFIGLAAILLSLVYLFMGIILAIIKETRSAGMGMLLTAGIMLLVGFTVCSFSTINI